MEAMSSLAELPRLQPLLYERGLFTRVVNAVRQRDAWSRDADPEARTRAWKI